ncbi:MAG: AraC family transcriptional regulator [Myxococcota bacterium]
MADLPNLANPTYVERVNRAVDYILSHLDEPLPLPTVARVACFSPYHFHRIFRALTGETLAHFVKRVRLERAVQMLAHHPGRSLTDVALACGFSGSSDFSRSFKAHYGVPPRVFDVRQWQRTHRRALEDAWGDAARPRLSGLPAGDNPDGFATVLRTLPARRVAYLRVHRPYEGDGEAVRAACAELVEWAKRRGLQGGQWLGYQWEDPEIVPLAQCRYDVGVEVPEDAPLDGVSEVRFAEMKVAELSLAGPIDLEMRALDWMYRTWLPNSGFVPAHLPAFEAWEGEPFAHGMEHFALRIQLPVVEAFSTGGP